MVQEKLEKDISLMENLINLQGQLISDLERGQVDQGRAECG